MRIYNPALGRFLSVDPITAQYPELTPYQFASNTPIESIDRDGLERITYKVLFNSDGSFKSKSVTVVTHEEYLFGLIRVKLAETHHVRMEMDGTGMMNIIDENVSSTKDAAKYIAKYINSPSEVKGAFKRNAEYLEALAGLALQSWIDNSDGSDDTPEIPVSAMKQAYNIEDAVWAQKTYGKYFSEEGLFSGRSVEEVAGMIKNNKIKVEEVPIDVVVRDGQTFILNTRSSAALSKAGISRDKWKVNNRTGDSFFEGQLDSQLGRNKNSEGGFKKIKEANGSETIQN